MRARALLVLLVLAALLAASLPAGAFHGESGPEVARDLVFTHEGGNEWWVQVDLSGAAEADVVEVEARDEGGPWVALEEKSWGDWAGSFHVEPGHRVTFAARFSDGATMESCWFTHPDGVAQCDEGFAATFIRPNGNEWWVQVKVDANEPLSGVGARVAGEEWHALSWYDWGAWAGSFHVPDGALVEFRAWSKDGNVDYSDAYHRWPDGEAVAREQVQWPHEGSYMTYWVNFGEYSPGGGWSDDTELEVRMTYLDGRWEAVCEGWNRERYDWREPPVTNESFLVHAWVGPPRAPTDTYVGDQVEHGILGKCSNFASMHFDNMTVERASDDHETTKDGRTVESEVWHASYEPECNCLASSSTWHRETGILLSWGFGGRMSYHGGWLVDTDAPIARGDEPRLEPPADAWPGQWSYVDYEAARYHNSSTVKTTTEYEIRFRYDGEAWRFACEGTRTDHNEGTTETFRIDGHAHPPLGPLRIDAGDTVRMNPAVCAMPRLVTVAQGTFPEDTMRWHPHRATVWWADEPDAAEAAGEDRDAWWDVDTGLLIRWEEKAGNSEVVGRLVKTDAPLSSG